MDETKRDQLVSVDGLVAVFDGHQVLKQTSFEVLQNEFFVMVGPLGAGKSLIFEILAGHYRADSGKVRVLRCDPYLGRRTLAKKIGFVSSQGAYEPDLSVEDNLLVFAKYHRIPTVIANRRIPSLLRQLGLQDLSDFTASELREGEKRRLSLARALVHDPDFLILDEISFGLSPDQARVLRQVVKEISQNKSVFLLSSSVADAESLADRIAFIDKGKILCQGLPSDLIQKFIGGEVMELNCDRDDFAYLRSKLDGQYQYNINGNNIRIFLNSAESRSSVKDIVGHDILFREPRLEDVFVRLTGTDLKEGQK